VVAVALVTNWAKAVAPDATMQQRATRIESVETIRELRAIVPS
jgi:hypothetical protein